MKRVEDFRRDFGTADERFCRCIKEMLSELSGGEEKPVGRIRWSAAAALVLMLLGITAAVAAAGNWGIMDFVNMEGFFGNDRRTANLEAESIVEVTAESVSVSDGVAEYTVTQSAHDGVFTYLTVHARPLEENMLLLGDRVSVGNSTLYLNKNGLGDEMTIGEYCVQQGLEAVKVSFEGMTCLDMTLREDGSTTFMLAQNVYTEGGGHHPDVLVHAGKDTKPVMLSYEVSRREIVERYVGQDSTDFDGLLTGQCRVEVIRTEMTNYLIIRHPEVDLSGDTSVRYEVLVDGEKTGSGAVDLTGTVGDCTVLTFASECIGEKLTVLATRITYGEPVEAVDGNGNTIWSRCSTGYESMQHTFSLERTNE